MLDWFETESANFWKSDPGAPPPADIKTEVFFIPAAANPENDGTLTNTQRLLQWHTKAIDPPGDCRSDSWFVYNLGKRLRQLYAGSTDPRDEPLLGLTWNYDYDEPARLPDGSTSRIEDDVDAEKVLMEMNGYKLDEIDPRTGRPRLLTGFSELKDGWHDRVRHLDLQRCHSRARPQPGPPAKPHRQSDSARVGVRLAGQPPRAFQPRLGRSRWPALVGAEEARLVGCREAPLGGPRPAGLRAGQAARLSPAARRHGHGGHRGQSSRSS